MVDNGVSKQEASQAKRLASIRAKQELQRQQKTVVAEALSAIKLPGSKPNHIVFESDSSDNETAPLVSYYLLVFSFLFHISIFRRRKLPRKSISSVAVTMNVRIWKRRILTF